MAVVQINLTVGGNDQYGSPLAVQIKGVGDPVAGVPAITAVDADVATLVADGATPTQGHVNTLNTDWTAYKTARTTFTTGILTGNATFSMDTSVITTKRQAFAALAAIKQAIEGGYGGLAA